MKLQKWLAHIIFQPAPTHNKPPYVNITSQFFRLCGTSPIIIEEAFIQYIGKYATKADPVFYLPNQRHLEIYHHLARLYRGTFTQIFHLTPQMRQRSLIEMDLKFEIVCEVVTSGDEINSGPFVKSFFEELMSIILELCPPKISPKKLVERSPNRAFESPLGSKYSTPPVRSSRENTFVSRLDEGTSSRNKLLVEEEDRIQSDDKKGNCFIFFI